MSNLKRLVPKLVLALTLLGAVAIPAQSAGAATSTAPTVALKVLVIGDGATDPTTVAWEDALTSEGVPFTEVDATGAYGSETVTIPALTSSATVGNFNGVVLADTDAAFASGQLTALFTYESDFGIRQISGYGYPDTTRGETAVASPVTTLDNTTGTVTAAGLAALPALKGTIPFDVGTYGVEATTTSTNFTPWITNTTGVLAGLYQHPNTDAQGGVSELMINFDYNYSSLQWLLLAPTLINWVTQDTHLGLYRNYFGQDIDDNFIADNEWSSTYQCTPAATDPIDFGCPAGVGGNAADGPPDVQMSAADVAYVVAWEQQTGIQLNLAFNAVGACDAPTQSTASCTGSITEGGKTYTDPGFVTDTTAPDDAALISALLADQADFNWTIHTWSHEFLGCNVWQQQPLTSVVANASGGTFTAGAYNYEITAATAYGESEPSVAQSATVATGGSVTLTWPDAPNGSGTTGNAGPTLFQKRPTTPVVPVSGATTSIARTRVRRPTGTSVTSPKTPRAPRRRTPLRTRMRLPRERHRTPRSANRPRPTRASTVRTVTPRGIPPMILPGPPMIQSTPRLRGIKRGRRPTDSRTTVHRLSSPASTRVLRIPTCQPRWPTSASTSSLPTRLVNLSSTR